MAVRRDKFGCDAQECARESVDYPLFFKSIANGMLGSAGTSKIQADVSENWATVSGGDAEFMKESRS